MRVLCLCGFFDICLIFCDAMCKGMAVILAPAHLLSASLNQDPTSGKFYKESLNGIYALYLDTKPMLYFFFFLENLRKIPLKKMGISFFFSEYHLIPCTKAVLELSSASLQPWILSTTVKCIKINLSGIYSLQAILQYFHRSKVHQDHQVFISHSGIA